MKIAIYCRVAATHQISMGDQVAMDAQEARLRRYCLSQGYEVVSVTREFRDGLTLARPGIHSINVLAEKHAVDGIIAADHSRIARRTSDILAFGRGLQKHGVECRIAVEGEAFEDLPSIIDHFGPRIGQTRE